MKYSENLNTKLEISSTLIVHSSENEGRKLRLKNYEKECTYVSYSAPEKV